MLIALTLSLALAGAVHAAAPGAPAPQAATAPAQLVDLLPPSGPPFTDDVAAKVRAASARLPARDRQLAERLITILAAGERNRTIPPAEGEELLDIYAELARNWAARSPRDFDSQWQAAARIHFLSSRADAAGLRARPELAADGAARARRVLAAWPDKAKSHALVASTSEDTATQLREYVRCRELDPGDAFCRDHLALAIDYHQLPRCKGAAIKKVAIYAAAETGPDRPARPTLEPKPALTNADIASVEEVADEMMGGSVINTTKQGKARLAALTAKAAASDGWLVVVVDGVPAPAFRTLNAITDGRVRVPQPPLCKSATRAPLPPALRRWAEPPAN